MFYYDETDKRFPVYYINDHSNVKMSILIIVSGEKCFVLVKVPFMILQDVYGTGGSLSEADRMALAIISYIGCGVSFIAMCLTLLTFLMFK